MKSRHEISDLRVIVLVVVVLVLHDLLFWGYSIATGNGGGARPTVAAKGDVVALEDLGPAPEFTGSDLASRPVSLASLKGKVVLVNFWGTWCKSCCDEMPGIDKVYQRFRDQGFEIVGVAVEFEDTAEESLAKIRKKVAETGVSFPVMLGNDALVKTFGGKPENFPQSYLIDGRGRVRKKIVGARQESYWESLVQSALAEPR